MSYIEQSLGQGEVLIARARFHWWYSAKAWAALILLGWFTLKTFEVALPNIEGVQVTQTFRGRLLGYGHLRIEGTGVDHVDLPDIADPIGFRAAIETAKSGGP